MKRSLFDIISSAFQSKKPTSFGEHRAARMEERLQKAVSERRTLHRAQAAADAPLDNHLAQRGDLVSTRISRLQQQLSDRKR